MPTNLTDPQAKVKTFQSLSEVKAPLKSRPPNGTMQIFILTNSS